MLILLGFLIVLVSVFGSFVALGGHFGALYQPFELLLIAGSAVGAYIASNNGKSIQALLRAIPDIFRPSPYSRDLAMQLMGALYVLLDKARREGVMALERDIDDPAGSELFAPYGLVTGRRPVMEFLTDYFRLMISGNMSALEIETLMDEEIETFLQEQTGPADALHTVADALPAFGIVAAVLGVIKALAAVDQPPAILADLISKAMVGTFLGILLAYGFVAPLGWAMVRRANASIRVLECIKATLLASINGYPPQLAVEFGRKVLYASNRPSFLELEQHLRDTRSTVRGAQRGDP